MKWIEANLRYQFNNQQYKLRQEAFGGLLFCRRTLSVLWVAPFATKVLKLCESPTTQEKLLEEVGQGRISQLQEIEGSLQIFLDKMTSVGVLIKG